MVALVLATKVAINRFGLCTIMDLEAAYQIGRENQRARQLLANHCVHPTLDVQVSPLGHEVRLPIGRASIRCPHAPFFGLSAMQGIEVAIQFYEENCVGCPHRSPSGALPTIVSEVEARRAQRGREELAAQGAATDRRSAWQLRKTSRDQSILGQPYPTEDLKAQIDVLDFDPALDQPADDLLEIARRKLIEAARGTPNLFTAPLIDTIVVLAESGDPTAYQALLALAQRGCLAPQRVTALAIRTLSQWVMPEAGAVISAFPHLLTPDEVTAVSLRVIALTAEPDAPFRPGWDEPAPLLALGSTHWPTIEIAVIAALRDENDEVREVGAHAARHLLLQDVSRLASLGEPLVRAIRSRESAYAGEPDATGAVLRALTSVWRIDPTHTREMVEANAGTLDQECRERLVRAADNVLATYGEELASDEALRTAVQFLIARLDGSWGSLTTIAASRELTSLARTNPDLVVEHLGDLIGQLLAACSPPPEPSSIFLPPRGPLDDMERMLVRQQWHTRRDNIAETIGVVVRSRATDAVGRILTLLKGINGDTETDITTRIAMLDVLKHAVTAGNVARMLPVLYTSLLNNDYRVRAASVNLWRACSAVADVLPENLEALLPALLSDPRVAVHGAMADNLPRLQISDRARAGSLNALVSIVRAHDAADGDSAVLRNALSATLWAALLCQPQTRDAAALFVIERSAALHPLERERVLLLRNLAGYRHTTAWATAALDVFARTERSEVVGRRDPLLSALHSAPLGVEAIPAKHFEEIALANTPDSLAVAADLVELLQVARRWVDAADLALRVAETIPKTKEFESRRTWFSAVAEAARAEARVSVGTQPTALSTVAEGVSTRPFWIHASARAKVRLALHAIAKSEPRQAITIVQEAIETLDAAPGGDERVSFYIDALRISVQLLRYDVELRTGSGNAERYLRAVRRNADDLLGRALDTLDSSDPIVTFVTQAADVTSDHLDDAIAAAAAISVALPLSDNRIASPRRERAIPQVSGNASAETEEPLVVCVLLLNGSPVVDTVVLPPEVLYGLSFELRMETWPEWAERCEIELLSTLPPDVVEVPKVDVRRDQSMLHSYGISLSAKTSLRLRSPFAIGTDALDLPILARFTASNGRSETAIVAGYERLRIAPYDETLHALTGRAPLDKRLIVMYDELRRDKTLDENDVRNLCIFFTACVRAANILMFDEQFRAGTRVTETLFHNELEKLLRADPTLVGALTRRDRLALGFDDLMYDGIVAELKVVKRNQKAVEGAARYIAQPTQYAVDVGSRLSILIVLDHSPKDAPARVLENDIGWEHPMQFGGVETPFPSRVAKLTIPTNWHVPSALSKYPNEVRTIAGDPEGTANGGEPNPSF